jgi:succinate-semialdehyde dehydrogenase/glutarate-semialdehyde dehydrogenase
MTTHTTTMASLFIGGKWAAPEDGSSLKVRNPADGSLVGTIGYGGKVEALVAEAEAAGARRVTEAKNVSASGTFVAPALFTDVPQHIGLARQEVFGPIAGVFPFGTEEEAVQRANETEMGLAAYFYTGRLDRAWRMMEALEAGIVGLNSALPSVAYAPMGGVKQSGLGREGSHQGLEEFQEIKYVCTEL